MSWRGWIVVAAALAILGSSGAAAGAAEPERPRFPKQVVLTTSDVERIVATLGPVEALGKKYDTDDDTQYDAHGDVGAQIKRALQNSGAQAEFNAIVAKQGFNGFDEWWPVAFSVICAASPPEDLNSADLAATIARTQNDPHLTPGQKAAIIAEMQEGATILEEMRPPPQNLVTVAPYAARVNGTTNAE